MAVLSARGFLLRAIIFTLALAPLPAAAPPIDETACPPSSSPPLIKRKSIVIKEGRFGEGTMEFHPDVVILKLHGTSFEMGYQHGSMLKDEIRERLEHAEKERGLLSLDKSWAMLDLYPALSENAREELTGISQGAGIPLVDLIWLNSLDLADDVNVDEEEKIPEVALWISTDLPGWMVAVYHPEGEPKYATVTRPGGVGALGGMRESGCCLTAEKKELSKRFRRPAMIFLDTRRNLGQGLCGADKDLQNKSCALEFGESENRTVVLLLGDAGLICMSQDAGASFSAIDLATETWRPKCGICPY